MKLLGVMFVLPTCTAELLGLYNAVTKTLHLAYMLKEIFDCDVFPVHVHGDNMSSLQIVKGNNSKHSSKYLGTKYYALQQLEEEGKIKIHYVSTKDNRSDGMTKSLNERNFKKLMGYCFKWFSSYSKFIESGNVCGKSHLQSMVENDSDDARMIIGQPKM